MNERKNVAIIGSGNIGTDVMAQVLRTSDVLEMGAFVGSGPTLTSSAAPSDEGVR